MEQDVLVFYEGELDLLETPERFKEWLYAMHETYEFYDISDLLDFYEQKENYLICAILRDFQNEITKK